ncbi:caspase domain-containing protein [Myxococcota bacterium]
MTRCRARLVLFAALAFPSMVSAQVARFALVAGNNRGADRKASLRYANRDAERFADILVELGGFERHRIRLLREQSMGEFRDALAQLDQAARAVESGGEGQSLLVVFFSGHADGVSLELGGDRLPFVELRHLLESSAATTKVAFVDSCHSGGLTATKGGRPGPSFDLVLAETLDTNGTAIVTSSSAHETSQESGEVQGSYFTHHLLSGLRGAADQNQDQQVTLTEVYEYAYSKTVVETARTMRGTQHPSYDYQLAGRGEVVLTSLSRGQATLGFGPEMGGSFLVVNLHNQTVAAEVTKPTGDERHLALPPGDYLVAQRRGDGTVLSAELSLEQGAHVAIDAAELREQASLVTSLKQGHGRRSSLGLVLHYGMLSGVLNTYGVTHQGAIGMRIDLGPVSLIPRWSMGMASIDDPDESLAYDMRLYSLESYVLWRFEYGLLDLFAGANLGVSYGVQRVDDNDEFAGTVALAAAVIGLDLPLYEGLAVQAFWEAGASFFKIDNAFSQHMSLKGVVGVAYAF